MNIFSQMAVIILLAVVGLAFMLFSNGRLPKVPIHFPGGSTGNQADRHAPPTPSHTIIPAVLYMDQLNPRTLELVERFEIDDIPAMGISISRPNAAYGSIKLNSNTKEAYTVSENHACIGKDSKGMFIQDRKNDGRMRLYKSKKVVDEVELTDGLMIYLGTQPLRFVIPDLFDMPDENHTVMGSTSHNFTPDPFIRRRH